MRVGLKTWLRDFLGNKMVEVDPAVFFNLSADAVFREMAFTAAVNFIARAVAGAEIKTFAGGKEVKLAEHYRLNVSPNRNQNAGDFWQKAISQMYRNDDGALVIETDDKQLLVADSFSTEKKAVYDYVFTAVSVDGYIFERPFYMNEVWLFRQNNQNVRRVLAAAYESYGKLAAYTMKSYQQTRGRKGTMRINALPQGEKDFQTVFAKWVNANAKTFFEANSAILPLFNGWEYAELDSGRAYSQENTRDIRAQVDDIFDFTAQLMGIPPALLKGEKLEVSALVDNFLTFCIDPLCCDTIQSEINRKSHGLPGFLAGNHVKVDTSTIKHVDILDSAVAIDKLFGSGWSFNQIMELCGREKINEPWADEHMITKNYAPAADALRALDAEGGEKQ